MNFGLTHTHGADMIYEPFMRWRNRKAILEIKQKYNKQLIFDRGKGQLEGDANVITHLVYRGVFKRR
jgi:hypothetical protein